MDLQRFHVYLKDKYNVEKAYYFIGYVDGNTTLYKSLQECGYICIFKPTLITQDNKVKGNCDAELVLHTMIEYKRYYQAVIVTGDGDFHCLVKHLKEKNKLGKLLIPNKFKFSSLLREFVQDDIEFLNSLKNKLEMRRNKKERH